ncbi:MAG: PilZ domain-containing protein [Myxococcota bacterium]
MAVSHSLELREDRRRPLVLEVKRPGSPESLGWTVDVSGMGLKLAVAPFGRPGQNIRFFLSFPRLLRGFEMTGTVVWTGGFGNTRRGGCGVRVWAESDRARLRELVGQPLQVGGERVGIFVADPRAISPKTAALRRSLEESIGQSIDLQLQTGVRDAAALRQDPRFQICVVDAALRDAGGAHVLSELMIGDGTPYQGAVVAIASSSNAERLAQRLECDACLSHPNDITRWIETAALLVRRRTSQHRRRIDYI